jgi:hypothetical protein
MTKGTRFVEIPAARLVAELEDIGGKVTARGGSFAWRKAGAEKVFDLTVPGGRAMVRVFTTLDGGEVARDCGEDAVRVCLGALDGERFRPLEKGTKILRTAPQAAPDRVAVFLERLREEIRQVYARAKDVRGCPKCGKPMAQREGRFGPFLGCTGFPECRQIVNLPTPSPAQPALRGVS